MSAASADYNGRLFEAVCVAAVERSRRLDGLANRRTVGTVARQLHTFLGMADRRGVKPWFTHSFMARLRGVFHRNTSREIIRELVDLGLVKANAYRAQVGHTFTICWRAVRESGRALGVCVRRALPRPDGYASGGQTAEAYDQAMSEVVARRARSRAKRDQADQAARCDFGQVVTPEERREGLAAMKAALARRGNVTPAR